MKQNYAFKILSLVILLGAIMVLVGSCKKDDNKVGNNVDKGTVSGTVTQEGGRPISGAKVKISTLKDSVETGSDGKYTLSNIPIDKYVIEFSKKGFGKISKTVVSNDFKDGIATVNAELKEADNKISGVVTNSKEGDAPMEGVTVTLTGVGSVVTGGDGKYLFEGLGTDNYAITFSKNGFTNVTKTIGKGDFVDKSVVLNVSIGQTEILRGLTLDDLENNDTITWYYNSYRGGLNSDDYPHWDWSVDYMVAAMNFWGQWQEQNEGTTLQIRNSEADQLNPADLDMFDSYVYGRKKITEDNKILTIRMRTHDADAESPAYFGVQVVDLSAADPKAVKTGETETYGSSDYADFAFDLSAYIGKEVIIAIGVYREETGDYYKQLVLRRLAFAPSKTEDLNWLPGTEIRPDWKLTQEMVRSTMTNSQSHFTGESPLSGGRSTSMDPGEGYPPAYLSWRKVHHIGYEWANMPIRKDAEPFGSKGYVLKTGGSSAVVSTEVPQAYFYIKIPVSGGHNQLTLKGANPEGYYTYIKLTAIEDNGTVTDIVPITNTADDGEDADDGCFKFKHNRGDFDHPDDYADFVYDLSQFNGENVVFVLGVYKGEQNDHENKLYIYSIDIN